MSCNHSTNVCDIVCSHVANNERPILYVWRYSDDGQFGYNCGYDDHPEGQSYVPLCRECGQEKLEELSGLPEIEPGQHAWREKSENLQWHVEAMKEEVIQ